VHPTVLIDVPDGAECSREEIFGRVVTVETFTDESDAIARAKNMPYGLAASATRIGHAYFYFAELDLLDAMDH